MAYRKLLLTPHLSFDRLDDPPPKGRDPFEVGDLASPIPDAFVDGHAFARVAQNPGPDPVHFTDDDTPRSPIINVNESFVIDVYWDLTGPLIPAFCGTWAVTIFFESMGPDDFDFEIVEDPGVDFGCSKTRDRNTRSYHSSFKVPPHEVQVDPQRGTPYELNVSLILLSTCSPSLPAGIEGFIKLEDILFFAEP
jgi:hypothetical protein